MPAATATAAATNTQQQRKTNKINLQTHTSTSGAEDASCALRAATKHAAESNSGAALSRFASVRCIWL